MALPSTYADRCCSMARALEVVGERWTLLIVRDAFHGVRRFGDFATQLGIPRAVLANRLKLLVHEGVLTREDAGGAVEYRLTAKGVALWPIVRELMNWGDDHYSLGGVVRSLFHDTDGGSIDPDGRCRTCVVVVPVPEIRIQPGPGFDPTYSDRDPVFAAINTPRRLLDPIVTPRTPAAGDA